MGWVGDLRADYARYPGSGVQRFQLAMSSQGFWAVATFRLGQGIYSMPRVLGTPLKLAYWPLLKFIECITGIQLAVGARVGPGLYIGHFGAIIVSGHARIGARCNLSQGITIGASTKGGRRGAPVIGDRVYIAPGAKVFGPITIGSDVAIGANAVVHSDVPAHVTVAGVPAKIVSQKGSVGLIELGAEEAVAQVYEAQSEAALQPVALFDLPLSQMPSPRVDGRNVIDVNREAAGGSSLRSAQRNNVDVQVRAVVTTVTANALADGTANESKGG